MVSEPATTQPIHTYIAISIVSTSMHVSKLSLLLLGYAPLKTQVQIYIKDTIVDYKV